MQSFGTSGRPLYHTQESIPMRRIQKALNRQLERVWRKLDHNLADMNECKDRLADLKADRESMISLAMKLVQITEGKTREVYPTE